MTPRQSEAPDAQVAGVEISQRSTRWRSIVEELGRRCRSVDLSTCRPVCGRGTPAGRRQSALPSDRTVHRWSLLGPKATSRSSEVDRRCDVVLLSEGDHAVERR